MKVVLFCGGLGTRLREHSDQIPKPLVPIGYRPIVWHLMRYYSHFGHNEFILCLGYRGEMIKRFFLDYDECMSNDFVYSAGGRRIQPLRSDIQDWRISFIDTGLHSNLGERLLAVKPLLDGDEVFLANYSDGLSDLPLDRYIDEALRRNVAASMVAVRTGQSFHALKFGEDGMVNSLGPMAEAEFWINGGYFVFRKSIFDYIRAGEELVEQPFQRMIAQRQLYSYRYAGYWGAMDTFKDKLAFDRRYARGDAPWEVWRSQPAMLQPA